jgi:hypothetical protein
MNAVRADAAMESGQKRGLQEDFGAMAKFRSCTFGNIMLVARQEPEARS